MTAFSRLLHRLFLADCTHSVFRPKAADQGAVLHAVRESTAIGYGQQCKASKVAVN